MKECTIVLPSRDLIEEVAAFIAKINGQAESNIGYCGRQKDEIASSLQNDLSDVPFEKAFVVAFVNEELVGVLGFDADLENKSVEIWGPFIEINHHEQMPLLFKKMINLVPAGVENLCMFPNKENKLAANLAAEFDFSKQSEQAILTMKRINFKMDQKLMQAELQMQFYNEVVSLHDLTFPGTYYSGKQIIDRMNEHRKVFYYEKEGGLAGYIYAEVEPEFLDASIEFFAVDEKFRGNGIGAELLKQAIHWIFSFKGTDELRLCVNAKNNQAIRIYEKTGFSLADRLHYYEKKLKVHA